MKMPLANENKAVTPRQLVLAAWNANLYARPYPGPLGLKCVAVCGIDPNRPVSAWRIARMLPAELDVPEPRTDGMVVYWPGMRWPEDF